MIVKDKWDHLRFQAWEDQGGYCDYCNNRVKLSQCVGHHIVNRQDGGRDCRENVVARHRQCEKNAHREHPKGNPVLVN